MTAYPPLSRYGVVGNLETCALVSAEGSVDWLPLPHVESPSVFARLLDLDVGGHFRVAPADPFDAAQSYLGRTNVLRTRFETDAGTATVTDFMPLTSGDPGGPPVRALARKVTGVRGTVDCRAEFRPRFDYARADTRVERRGGDVVATGGEHPLYLAGDADFQVDANAATAAFTVAAGESRWLVAQLGDPVRQDAARWERLLGETVEYWRRWSHTCEGADCAFEGPWHDHTIRSGLVLKLLTHPDTGAIAAAPTTSLPENPGGVRNWDYRYNWLRDAAFTIQALVNLGHVAEAREYVDWFLGICETTRPVDLQPLYGLHGDARVPERTLDHLSGYRNSAPVRVGNAAAAQRQLDVYGEVVLAIHETLRQDACPDPSPADWDALRDIVTHVAAVWEEPDRGIWEVRSAPRHFVHSKVQCWVALDRGVAMAEDWGFDAPLDRWREARDAVHGTVLDRGYDPNVGSFVQAFGSEALDAAALRIPVVEFLPFDDDRVQSTIDAVWDRLGVGNGLVHRYDGDDGLPGGEGTFLLCSFWLVDALALSGRVAEARDVFTSVLDYASPLGLLAEEVDPATGRLLGNFPQAFSHIGLLNSALYLGEVTGRKRTGPKPVGTERGQAAADD